MREPQKTIKIRHIQAVKRDLSDLELIAKEDAEALKTALMTNCTFKVSLAEPTEKELKDFNSIVTELKASGTLAGTIKYGQNDEWIGMVYKKDLSFTDPREQDHFGIVVFNGVERI